MPLITSISPSEKDPNRTRIMVDGKTVGTLVTSLVTRLNLTVGQEWNASMQARFSEAKAYAKAYKQAMNRISVRQWPVVKMKKKLLELGHDAAIVERVMAKLLQIGALDDAVLGRALIHEIQSRKPAGNRLIRVKLIQKGLDRKLVEQLMSEMEPDHDATVLAARELAKKKLRSMTRLDIPTRKRRLYGLLARRGFDSDVIFSALQNLPGVTGNGDENPDEAFVNHDE